MTSHSTYDRECGSASQIIGRSIASIAGLWGPPLAGRALSIRRPGASKPYASVAWAADLGTLPSENRSCCVCAQQAGCDPSASVLCSEAGATGVSPEVATRVEDGPLPL